MKRRCRLRKKHEDAEEVLTPGAVQISVPVDIRMVSDMRKLAMPDRTDYKFMIESVMQKMDMSWYCNITGINPIKVKRIRDGSINPTGTMARVIFLIYAINTMPERLNDKVFLSTFGLPFMKMPQPVTDCKAEVESFLAQWKGKKLTTSELHQDLCKIGKFIHHNTIRNVCKQIGYTLSNRRQSLIQLLSPSNFWLSVDWSKRNNIIAKKVIRAERTVRDVRIRLKRLPLEKLIGALRGAGVENPEAMADVLKRS